MGITTTAKADYTTYRAATTMLIGVGLLTLIRLRNSIIVDNLFSYCLNSPVIHADYTGCFLVISSVALIAIIGKAALYTAALGVGAAAGHVIGSNVVKSKRIKTEQKARKTRNQPKRR